MESVLHEIGKGLHLCSALMSDPIIMRRYPSVVADHFASTLTRIEHLRIFLRKPAGACPSKPWLDGSVLDGGIKKLVTLLLDRHMMPLRLETFPKVFERDLKQDEADDDAENLIEREIKESNCVGACVLLYYYFFWHALLIILNQKAHTCCVTGAGGEVDIYSIMSKFPSINDLLDYRHVGPTQNEDVAAHVSATEAAEKLMFDPEDMPNHRGEHTRRTNLVSIYREVLGHIATALDPSSQEHDEREDNEHLNEFQHTFGRIISLQANGIIAQLELLGGAYSTFHWQDDVSKWEDMYKDTEVHSDAPDGRGTQVYSCRLASILKSRPFHEDHQKFKHAARLAAIYDYGSVFLMTDVCKSLIALTAALGRIMYKNSRETIETVLMQVYAGNAVGHEVMDRNDLKSLEDDDVESDFHKTRFIQETLTVRRPQSTVPGSTLTGEIAIDDLMGYYWGSKIADWDRANHRYLAWPELKIDKEADSRVLDRIQYLCKHAESRRRELAFNVLAPATKNSLFVSSLFTTAKKLAEKLRCTQGPAYVDTRAIFQFDSKVQFVDFRQSFEGGSRLVDDKDIPATKPLPRFEQVSLPQCIAKMQLEYDALQEYAAKLKRGEFRKLAGISWPIVADDDESNLSKFRKVRLAPAILRSVQESANTMADLAHYLILQKERHGAVAEELGGQGSQQFV